VIEGSPEHVKKVLDEYDEWVKKFEENLAATKQRVIDKQQEDK